MKLLIATVLLTLPCIAQSSTTITGPAQTKGTCSQANTGNGNTFTFNCGIGEKQGKEILGILNKILASQMNAATVISKLNSCVEQVQEVREQQQPWRLTDDQERKLREMLSGTKANVAIYALSSDNNSTLLGQDLLEVLQSKPVDWDFNNHTLYYVPGYYVPGEFPPPDQIGVEILVADRYRPEIQPLLPAAHALNQALADVGVEARWTTVSNQTLLHMTSFGEKDLGNIIIIAVGAKPAAEAHP